MCRCPLGKLIHQRVIFLGRGFNNTQLCFLLALCLGITSKYIVEADTVLGIDPGLAAYNALPPALSLRGSLRGISNSVLRRLLTF